MKNYIGGQWVQSAASAYLPVINPATCELIGQVPDGTRADVDKAAQAAKAAFPEWRSTPVLSRAQYMYRFKPLLEDRFEDLAEIVVEENGKTRDEARGEVRRGIESVDFAASIPSIMRGYKVEDISSGIDETAERQPIGVFAAITPFNFPNMVPLWFLPTAITCGNTFIVKPSPQTPLSMDILFELLDELDLPEGVVNLVHGGKEASIAVMEHPDIVGVSFVGSTPVAKIVYETCAKHGKRVQAQGGAKNYIAVMPDADMQASVANIMGSAFGCAGQRCLAGSVVVAVGDAYEPLKAELVKRAANSARRLRAWKKRRRWARSSRQQARERIESMIAAGRERRREGRARRARQEGRWLRGRLVRRSDDPRRRDHGYDRRQRRNLRTRAVDHARAGLRQRGRDDQRQPLRQRRQPVHQQRQVRPRVQVPRRAGNIGINVGVAAATASFPFGGQKESFFGDLHGQGLDGVEFYTDKKILIERWF